MITKELNEYPLVVKGFTKFLIDKKLSMDVIERILKSNDLEEVLGYYLLYLETHKLILLVGDKLFTIYEHGNHFRDIVDCGADTNPLMVNYLIAIKSAFNIINNKLTQIPF